MDESHLRELEQLKQTPLCLDKAIVTTSTINTKIDGVDFADVFDEDGEILINGVDREKDIVRRLCLIGPIFPIIALRNMHIPSGTLMDKKYIKPEKAKSTRGRKKKIKVAKTTSQKNPGGTHFKSCIEFHVTTKFTRTKPVYEDANTKNVLVTVGDQETFDKVYKIKVFRTGIVTTSGVLREDFSDLREPLQHLINYLKPVYPNAAFTAGIYPSTQNYKCRALFPIDTSVLRDVIDAMKDNSILLDKTDLLMFLKEPVFRSRSGSSSSSSSSSRREHSEHSEHEEVEGLYSTNGPEKIKLSKYKWENVPDLQGYRLSLHDLIEHTKIRKNTKSMSVSRSQLTRFLERIDDRRIYHKLQTVARVTKEMFGVSVKQVDYEDILAKMLMTIIDEFVLDVSAKSSHIGSAVKDASKNNNVKVSAPIIKLKSAEEIAEMKTMKIVKKPKKKEDVNKGKPTLKIYPTGKINFMGKLDRQIMEYCYYWINDIIQKHPAVMMEKNKYLEDPDPDFESDSEDSDSD